MTTMAIPMESTLLPQLVRAYAAMMKSFEKSVGIHPARWRVLYVLDRIGPCAQAEISKHTHIDPAAITRIVRDFRAEGLVLRERSRTDARQVKVSLTDAGKAKLDAMRTARAAFLDKALSGFTAEEIEAVQLMLHRIYVNLDPFANPQFPDTLSPEAPVSEIVAPRTAVSPI